MKTVHLLLRVTLVCSFFMGFYPCSLSAQLSFTNARDHLPSKVLFSAIPVGISDMNGDGLDDLVCLQEGTDLYYVFQQADSIRLYSQKILKVDQGRQWTLCIGDLANEGQNTVLTAGQNDGVKLISPDASGQQFDLDFLPGNVFFAQGSNLVDINNDGFLDAFVCNDTAESRIWANDALGNLEIADDWIDMRTILYSTSSNNSGNYGSIWTDFDQDGDLDLYIAKCRDMVYDDTDPRRINALFVNDGQGNFHEDAKAHGLNIGIQSWAADFQDIDNDGDFDCFITNHLDNGQLLTNDGSGYFSDISGKAGISNFAKPWQGLMRDFDNDGFVDILIGNQDNMFLKNNGDTTFTRIESGLFGNDEISSFAIGDLNHDGFLDVYASNYLGAGSLTFTLPDVLWLNDGNTNNFLAVRLEGKRRMDVAEGSNRNGIGALIKIYGDWGIQIREVRAGESYGIHNSFTQHFGLGNSTQVDSIVVNWPSGIVDKYQNISANQFIQIKEGECVSADAQLSISGATTFPLGDSVVLSVPPGQHYLWSTGDSTASITVFESGNYMVSVTGSGSCVGLSKKVKVEVGPKTSVVSPEDNFPIQVYPNPANDQVHFQLDTSETGTLTINNSQGQKVYQKELTGPIDYSIELSDWPKGIYWIQVMIKEEIHTRKLILQ